MQSDLCALMKRILLLVFIALTVFGYGQVQSIDPTKINQDTVDLKEVIISATRTERKLTEIPMPFNLVTKKEIQAIGGSRLQDVLTEQKGLTIVPQINGVGNGLQLQGLGADYTMIMMDGEPLIGRYTGTLELSRIALGNIKKIEIVKGPSSSLYGSEALGGVVNIITSRPVTPRILLSSRLSTMGDFDANVELDHVKYKLSNQLFFNFFNSKGFDVDPANYGRTISPYRNFSFRHKLIYQPIEALELSTAIRIFHEVQDNEYQVIVPSDSIKVNGPGKVSDLTFIPQIKYSWKNNTQFYIRANYSRYYTETKLNELSSGNEYYFDQFRQEYFKPEVQSTCRYFKNQNWTAGAGILYESVNTNRYGENVTRSQHTSYLFLQHEWKLNPKVDIITGLRYDDNSVYHSQWSPKFSLLYKPTSRIQIKASFGTGFKAPDFRQLYLNFKNSAAGYSVFGTEVVLDELKKLQTQGLIEDIYISLDQKSTLKPEKSIALNFGMEYDHPTFGNFSIHFFRNDLKGLVEIQTVALLKNRQFIYSYNNIQNAYTEGFEAEWRSKLIRNFQISLSYNYLLAKDKDILNQIKQKQIYGRNPETLESYLITKKDYLGLYGRSPHSGIAKLRYQSKSGKWDASLRCIYRGSYGSAATAGSVSGTLIPSSDRNSNGILDRYDHLVTDYFILNAGYAYQINSNWRISTGVENLANYKDELYIPTLKVRNFFIQIQFEFFKKNKS